MAIPKLLRIPALGILSLNYKNGEHLKFTIANTLNIYTIKAIKNTFLKETSNCEDNIFNKCVKEGISNANYTCPTPCMPISIPVANSSINRIECATMSQYNCMRLEMNHTLFTNEKICPSSCSTIEYTGIHPM